MLDNFKVLFTCEMRNIQLIHTTVDTSQTEIIVIIVIPSLIMIRLCGTIIKFLVYSKLSDRLQLHFPYPTCFNACKNMTSHTE